MIPSLKSAESQRKRPFPHSILFALVAFGISHPLRPCPSLFFPTCSHFTAYFPEQKRALLYVPEGLWVFAPPSFSLHSLASLYPIQTSLYRACATRWVCRWPAEIFRGSFRIEHRTTNHLPKTRTTWRKVSPLFPRKMNVFWVLNENSDALWGE